MILWTDAKHHHNAFFYIDGGSVVCLSLDLLRKDISYLRTRPTWLKVTLDGLKRCAMPNYGWEKLKSVDLNYIEKNPVTMIEVGSDLWMLIDGNHRYIRAYMLKLDKIPARYVLYEIWSKYIIDLGMDGIEEVRSSQHNYLAFGNNIDSSQLRR